MLLILALAVSLASALIRPGRISSLAAVQIRGIWAIGLIFLFQFWAVEAAPGSWVGWTGPLVVSTQILLGAVLWINRALPGFRIVLLGTLLNVLVMAANGGYMPVSQAAMERAGHEYLIRPAGDRTFVASNKQIVLDPSETRLYALSDIFTVPRGAPVSGNFSIGDVLIAVGVAVFLHRAGGVKNDFPETQIILTERGRQRLL